MDQTVTSTDQPKPKGCLNTFLWIVVIGFLAMMAIAILFPEDSNKRVKHSPYIEGFDPINTYLYLKEWGFTVKRDYDSETGVLWTCTRVDDGITHVATIYSPKKTDKASSFRLTVTVEPGYAPISKGRYLTEKLSTIIYDSCDQSLARKFASENYNNDKASIVIGDAEFTMYAPSDYVRMLDIHKYVPQEEIQE